jgi:hypothetical protein
MTEHVAVGVPITLVKATLKGAKLVAAGELMASAASGRVAFLVQEGLHVMLWTKLQAVSAEEIIELDTGNLSCTFLTGL